MTKFHFLQFQKWPKSNFWTGKKFKTAKNAIWRNYLTSILAVFIFFPVQKLIFGHFWNCKKWNLVKKKFCEIDLFDFMSFFGLDFFKFSGPLWIYNYTYKIDVVKITSWEKKPFRILQLNGLPSKYFFKGQCKIFFKKKEKETMKSILCVYWKRQKMWFEIEKKG